MFVKYPPLVRQMIVIFGYATAFHCFVSAKPETKIDLTGLRGNITLNQAVSLALLQSPELNSYLMEQKAREAEVLQSKIPPNPEIEIEAEPLTGNGHFKNDEPEIKTSLGITLEVGGSRGRRINVAEAKMQQAQLEFEIKRLDITSQVKLSFLIVLLLQEHIQWADSHLVSAGLALKIAEDKFTAGKSSSMEVLKFSTAFSLSKMKVERLRADLVLAKRDLARVCGSPTFNFKKAVGSLKDMAAIPSWEKITKHLDYSPRLLGLKSDATVNLGIEKLERASSIPPVTFIGGIKKRPSEPGEAWIAGVSFPIPLWDWRQGAISAAKARHQKSLKVGTACQALLLNNAFEAFSNMSTEFHEIEVLEKEIIPKSMQTNDAAKEGYRLGKFTYLEFLDSQQNLVELRMQHIDTIGRYHRSRLALESILGKTLKQLVH